MVQLLQLSIDIKIESQTLCNKDKNNTLMIKVWDLDFMKKLKEKI